MKAPARQGAKAKAQDRARHLKLNPGAAIMVIAQCGAYVSASKTSPDPARVLCRHCRVSYQLSTKQGEKE